MVTASRVGEGRGTGREGPSGGDGACEGVGRGDQRPSPKIKDLVVVDCERCVRERIF